MKDAATQARELIRIVRDDLNLPEQVRHSAGRFTSLIASDPDVALELLEELHRDTVPNLPMYPPTTDYVRFLGLENFWRFNLDRAVKRRFRYYQVYQSYIQTAQNPAEYLAQHLGTDQIVPAINSWLVPANKVAGLTGEQAQRFLNSDQKPPYVVMLFSVTKMKNAGMLIREPCGIDTIPKRLTQWHPNNVPGERIDRDIPRSALARIEWLP